MKLPDIFRFDTLKIKLPFGVLLIYCIVLFPVVLFILEILLRYTNLQANLPPSTLDQKINYPEMDVKYQEFEFQNKVNNFDCIFLGTSMVDYGISPSEINTFQLQTNIKRPNCFNFALEAVMPETSSIIAKAFINKYGIKTIILGISAIDFAGKPYLTRKINNIPWLNYITGYPSFEGQIIDQSIVYRYFIALGKYRDTNYQNETHNLNLLINNYGQQIRQNENSVYRVSPNRSVELPDYSLYQPDISGLKEFGEFQKQGIKIIVFEIPVHPNFLPYYVPQGEKGYEELFIRPIESILADENIPFIRSQPDVADIVSQNGWLDYSHLNEKGATEFSRWLALKIDSIQ
ncbi:hypothetical protein [Leptolinea tardivitalis]|uniref:Uncharacterized protein n=1 Tax=Leptolinea tardivitalis TaxID=229920 RepID=A0A0N8GMF4_9CHLR|nr:hypothetical protein [Leptolinea tardivitalis]KPL75146.1 hypothetical protein ADM99_00595 [Leptolinea tardivitalis]GAP20367.1 hypothetical protein LTAR_00555 [Leptolinea tardivitalis]